MDSDPLQFHLAKDQRLKLTGSCKEFPSIEKLLERFPGSSEKNGNVSEVVLTQESQQLLPQQALPFSSPTTSQSTSSTRIQLVAPSPPRDENVDIRKQLELEAKHILNILRKDETKRAARLAHENHLRSVEVFKQRQTANFALPPIQLPTTTTSLNMATVSRFTSAATTVSSSSSLSSSSASISQQAPSEMVDDMNVVVETEGHRSRHRVAKVIKFPNVDMIKEVLLQQGRRDTPLLADSRKASIVRKCVLPVQPRLPQSATWAPITHNITTDDEAVLRAVPYFGDDEAAQGFDVSHYDVLPGELELEVLGEAEEHTVAYMIEKHKRGRNVVRFEVYSALSSVLHLSVSEIIKAYNRLRDGFWYRRNFDEKSVGERRMLETSVIDLADVSDDAGLVNLGGKEVVFDPDQPANQARGFGVGLGILNTDSYHDLTSGLKDFFCRRCYSYLCHHGIDHPAPRERSDPSPPFPCPLAGFTLSFDSLRQNRRASQQGSQRLPQSQSENSSMKERVDRKKVGFGGIAKDGNLKHLAEFVDDFFVKDGKICLKVASDNVSDCEIIEENGNGGNQSNGIDHAQVVGAIDKKSVSSAFLQQYESCKRQNTDTKSSSSSQVLCSTSAAKGDSVVTVAGNLREVMKSTMAIDHMLYRPNLLIEMTNYGKVNNLDASNVIDLVDEDEDEDDEYCLFPIEKTLIRKLNEIYDSYQPGFNGLGDAKSAVNLNRESFIASMLGTRSKDEIVKALRNTELTSATLRDTHVNDTNTSKRPNSRQTDGARKVCMQNKNSFSLPYTACNHEGPCSAANGCECIARGTFCEKYCGCSKDCIHRFPGCRCRRGACLTKACPCFAASRACDPDLCGPCGAYIPSMLRPSVADYLASLPDKGKSLPFRMCRNEGFAIRPEKKLLVRPSTIHGWGVFAGEAIEKGEFVCQYVGEVISQEEAERRGIVYDKQNSSFIFNLNKCETIDAKRKGNKAKFINHSEEPIANCVPRIIQDDGDHKVALFSKRAIAVGEELTFDYGYSSHAAPQWAKSSERSNDDSMVNKKQKV
eukprot:gene8004-8828_t